MSRGFGDSTAVTGMSLMAASPPIGITGSATSPPCPIATVVSFWSLTLYIAFQTSRLAKNDRQ